MGSELVEVRAHKSEEEEPEEETEVEGLEVAWVGA